ncbi:MAG: hypothetical protein FJ265_06945 [Planctomycetes bacterium]|nr:hypothetical protein [Planctomycetota bacterium]
MIATDPTPADRSLLATLDRVLRGNFTRREALATGRIDLPVGRLIGLCLLLGAIYGICLGSYSAFNGTGHAWLQTLASALKVPLLFVLTLLVSFPSLYVFAALQRLPLDFRNTLKLMLLAVLVDLTVIASLGPVFAFFAASSTSYAFLLLLNVAIFALGGVLGLAVLRRATRDVFTPVPPGKALEPAAPVEPGATPPVLPPALSLPAPSSRTAHQAADQARRLLAAWCVVYGVVGAQMGWLLRPFLGNPGAPFEWFRAREDNFLVAVLRTIGNLFGR